MENFQSEDGILQDVWRLFDACNGFDSRHHARSSRTAPIRDWDCYVYLQGMLGAVPCGTVSRV